MKAGFTGKIIEVNLSLGRIEKINIDSRIVQQYLGGAGLGVKILYDQAGPEIDAFSEDNIIVIAPGPLSGTAAPTNGRTHIVTKSPLTGIMGMGNFGGFWGPRLKKAGYEGVIIRGKAKKPVYLWINDENVQLIGANGIWGKDTYETSDLLKKDLGSDVSVLAIGQAGENLVKFACPVADYYHAPGRSHAGCVMGDKKLKAIAVRGTKEIKLTDRVKFHEALIEATDRIIAYPDKGERRKIGSHSSRFKLNTQRGLIRTGNYADGELPPDHDFYGLPTSMENNVAYRPNSFGYNCVLAQYYGCDLEADVDSGPYAGVKLSGIGFSHIGNVWGAAYGMKTYPAMFKSKELCNRYGMDSVNPTIMAIELFERGIIDKNDVDGLDLRVGNEKDIMEMLRKIAYREGFGNILAEGADRAAKLIGRGAEWYSPTIKGHQVLYYRQHRAGAAQNFGTVTCTRGGDDLNSTHVINDSESIPEWANEVGWSKEQYVTWLINYIDIFPEEKEKIYGSPPRLEFFDKKAIDGKARLVVWFEHIASITNSLGTCICASHMFPALGPTHLAKLYSAATGWEITPRELMKTGERIYNLMKAYNVRAGLTRKDDHYPERFYTEPVSGGPAKGTVVIRENLDKMLDEYYEIRGWDVKTGIPTKEKLVELGLGDVAEAIL